MAVHLVGPAKGQGRPAVEPPRIEADVKAVELNGPVHVAFALKRVVGQQVEQISCTARQAGEFFHLQLGGLALHAAKSRGLSLINFHAVGDKRDHATQEDLQICGYGQEFDVIVLGDFCRLYIPVDNQGPLPGQRNLRHIVIGQILSPGLFAGMGKQTENGLIQIGFQLVGIARHAITLQDGHKDVQDIVEQAALVQGAAGLLT